MSRRASDRSPARPSRPTPVPESAGQTVFVAAWHLAPWHPVSFLPPPVFLLDFLDLFFAEAEVMADLVDERLANLDDEIVLVLSDALLEPLSLHLASSWLRGCVRAPRRCGRSRRRRGRHIDHTAALVGRCAVHEESAYPTCASSARWEGRRRVAVRRRPDRLIRRCQCGSRRGARADRPAAPAHRAHAPAPRWRSSGPRRAARPAPPCWPARRHHAPRRAPAPYRGAPSISPGRSRWNESAARASSLSPLRARGHRGSA